MYSLSLSLFVCVCVVFTVGEKAAESKGRGTTIFVKKYSGDKQGVLDTRDLIPSAQIMENYTVIGKIGGGAEGIVFRVRHEPTKKEFAMKVIRCPDHSRVNSALKEIKVLLHLRHRHVVSYVDFFLLFHNDTIRHEFVADYKNEAQLSESTRSLGFCSTGCLGSNGSPVVRNEVLSDVFCFHPSEVCVCLVMALCTSGDMQDTIEDARRRLMDVGSHPIPEAQILSWMEQCASALAFIHEQGFLHRDLKPTNVFFDDDKEIKIGDFGLAATVGLGR
ncbi:protein kinase, partial [Trypanosoma cruzi]